MQAISLPTIEIIKSTIVHMYSTSCLISRVHCYGLLVISNFCDSIHNPEYPYFCYHDSVRSVGFHVLHGKAMTGTVHNNTTSYKVFCIIAAHA